MLGDRIHMKGRRRENLKEGGGSGGGVKRETG
jgi:hypothetical protein